MDHAISPLDGRYGERLSGLRRYFSEPALMAARCRVEVAFLLAFDELGVLPPMNQGERARAAEVAAGLSEADVARIKEIEAVTRHDVKAVEIYLGERLALARPERVHLGLTSEDVNNLAYTTLFRDYVLEEQLPALEGLAARLAELAARWRDEPFPAHTHGQPASPTTAGKELAVFLARLTRQIEALRALRFRGKLSGATGTYAALGVAFPEEDWMDFARGMVAGLGLLPNLVTTQVEDHDTWAEWLDLTRRVNNIVIDLDRDVWAYISRDLLRQRVAEGQVGSSTMPHKINPIRFENSEGNLELSNALLATLSDKLCRSRMQRDLSDSTVTRNVGVAMAHAWLGIHETTRGLERVELDRARCRAALSDSPQVLAEPYQVALRAAGITDAYERLRGLTQGRQITRADLTGWLDELDIPGALRERLAALTPEGYTGAADRVVDLALAEAGRVLTTHTPGGTP